MKKELKQSIKNRIRASSTAKRIIKKQYKVIQKFYKVVEEEEKKANVNNAGNNPCSEQLSGDVFFPRNSYPQYNNRIYNYLLETHCGEPVRRWVIEQMAFRETGRFPNLDSPVGLNEKMQWMRLHYHDPLMTKCVDKCSFKEYIKETVGEQYVVPLYGVWNNVNDIDFQSLPNAFALKSTWGWGDLQNILVRNKESLDIDKAKASLAEWLMPWNNYYYQSFEWDSKDIKPRVLAEQLLQPDSGEIIDYKFYCYNGVCRHFLVCKDRKTETKYINYDLNFQCLKLSPRSYFTDEPFTPPSNYQEMLNLAEKLAKPFPLVRVDFYDVDGKLYVGEMTFSPGGGFNTYYDEWDRKLGSYLTLPEANI